MIENIQDITSHDSIIIGAVDNSFTSASLCKSLCKLHDAPMVLPVSAHMISSKQAVNLILHSCVATLELPQSLLGSTMASDGQAAVNPYILCYATPSAGSHGIGNIDWLDRACSGRP